MAVLKPKITNKYSEKTQNNTENLKNKPIGSPTFTVAGRRGQFAPPAAAADRPKHRKNFH